ncbi:hypothetical protein HA402_000541 [Bradysia odoriphaga]|nr:hypothetical protein HA402_000541 [Bradysia odoriphaga]
MRLMWCIVMGVLALATKISGNALGCPEATLRRVQQNEWVRCNEENQRRMEELKRKTSLDRDEQVRQACCVLSDTTTCWVDALRAECGDASANELIKTVTFKDDCASWRYPDSISQFSLSETNAQNSFGIKSCTFKNGQESVEVNCSDTTQHDDCFTSLFVGNCSEKNRSKVKTLRTVKCGENLQTLTQIFKNVRELDISFDRNGNLSSDKLNYPFLEKLNASNSYMGLDSSDFANIPNVMEIDLSNNDISHVWDQFSNLRQLKLLDLSGNWIEDVPPVQNLILNVENNGIQLNGRLFSLIKNNVTLRLSWDKINHLDNDLYAMSVTPSLYRIDVDEENVIFRVTESNNTLRCSRYQFQHIEFFSFRRNHFDNIPQLLAAMGPSVRYLGLSSNYIGKITSTTFEGFTMLRSLYLDDTDLTVIEPNAFKHQKELRNVDLSNNNLKHFDLSVLSGLNNLKRISISNIHVENIQEKFNLLPSSVEILDASSNFIGKLNVDTFDNLTALFNLNLRNTSLFEIEPSAFQRTKRLTELVLSDNHLKQVNFNARRIEKLWLQGNELDLNLDLITTAVFPDLKELVLFKDRFSCEYWESFSKRMKMLRILQDNRKKCYNKIDNII